MSETREVKSIDKFLQLRGHHPEEVINGESLHDLLWAFYCDCEEDRVEGTPHREYPCCCNPHCGCACHESRAAKVETGTPRCVECDGHDGTHRQGCQTALYLQEVAESRAAAPSETLHSATCAINSGVACAPCDCGAVQSESLKKRMATKVALSEGGR